MTVLEDRSSAPKGESRSRDWGSFFGNWFGTAGTAAGVSVNEDNAKRHTAVFAAIQQIAGSMASLPIKLYRKMGQQGRVEARRHPAWDVVHNAPNNLHTAADLKSWGTGHLLTRGNMYALRSTDGLGRTDGLFLQDPDQVTPKLLDDGTVAYLIPDGDGGRDIRLGDEVLHIKGLGSNGLKGFSPIRVAREAIAQGLAVQEYSARFFGNNSRPDGILTTPNSLGKEASERLKQQWEEAQAGLENAHKVAVLEEGLTWEQMGLSAEDAQLIEAEKMGWQKVAQIFGLPPHKIAAGDSEPRANVEAQNLEYLTDTLLPWLTRWEEALNQTLLSERERREGLHFEFVVDALLRADSEKRAQMIETRIKTGTWTINDVRRLENEDPLDVPGADEPMVQMQDIPLSQAVEMDPEQRARMIEERTERDDGEARPAGQ